MNKIYKVGITALLMLCMLSVASAEITPIVVTGSMTGQGVVFDGNQADIHQFNVNCDITKPQVVAVNYGGSNNFYMTTTTKINCFNDPAYGLDTTADINTIVGTGAGMVNGVSGYTISYTFKDAMRPIQLNPYAPIGDRSDITIKNSAGTVVLHTAGNLYWGNHIAGR